MLYPKSETQAKPQVLKRARALTTTLCTLLASKMLAFCRRAISSYFGCFQVPGEGVWVGVLVTESLEAGVDGAETRASFELTVWLMFAEEEKENK